MGLFREAMKTIAKEVVNELSDVHPKEQQEETLQEKTEAQQLMSQLSSEEILQVINRPNIKDVYFEAGQMEINRRIDAYDQLVQQIGKEEIEKAQQQLRELTVEQLEGILSNQKEFEPEIVLFAQFEIDDRDLMRMTRERFFWES